MKFLIYLIGMKILIELFFSLRKDSRTRGHDVTLGKDQCRMDMINCSFSQRKVNEWKTLYTDCINASSVNVFKNKIDTDEGGLHKMTNVGLSVSSCTQALCYLTKFTFDVAPKILNHHANISPVNDQCHHFGERGSRHTDRDQRQGEGENIFVLHI